MVFYWKQLNSCGDEFHIGDIAEPVPCGYTLKGTIPCNEICNTSNTSEKLSTISPIVDIKGEFKIYKIQNIASENYRLLDP